MEFDPADNRQSNGNGIATLNQRLGALLVDFLSCWFLAELLQAILTITTSAALQFFAFLVMWVIFRVFVPAKSQGQSFGRWLMSVRIVDAQYGRTATVGALFTREVVVFICSLILLKTITSTLIVFAWIPFVADAALAIADSETRQTIHDRLGGTIAIQSRRGFALPSKITNFLNQAGEKAAEFYGDGDREDASFGNQRLDNQRRNGRRGGDAYGDSGRVGGAQAARGRGGNGRRRYAQRDLWDDMAAQRDSFRDDGEVWDDVRERDDFQPDTRFNDVDADLEGNFNADESWDQEPPPQPSVRRPRRGRRPRG